jgi:succinyl-CoA synthetase alpha subunit
MIGQLSRHTPVIVQGATGRTGSVHVRRMKEYGTNIVAGVSARAGADSVEGVPVFADCRAAIAVTGAKVSLAMVPPNGVLAAAQDAFGAGIKLLVTVAEGVPVHDALRIGRMARDTGALWVGASTPGLAIPGEMKLGFLPDVSLRPGPLGMMSKSGTLSYETGYRLGAVGLGTSIWVGVGGDPVKGVRFPDLLDTFLADERTKGIVLVGEVAEPGVGLAAMVLEHPFDEPDPAGGLQTAIDLSDLDSRLDHGPTPLTNSQQSPRIHCYG